MKGTRTRKAIGIGLLLLAMALSLFNGLGGQQPNMVGGVPAAHAEGGGPPDLTKPNGENQPTPTPTPTPISLP
ncbi:MAG: hypothetical protein M3441_11100 [Chloroflexota bacterium]|nr:hypothetical protein [Chloroflexota bacterium]